jgi:gliding motility-associated-like protein
MSVFVHMKKWFLSKFSLFTIFTLLVLSVKGQITVNNTNNGTILAQKLAGDGVAISNAVMQCEQNQSGLFVALSSNLGEDSGIVLTTGLAASNFPNTGVNGNASSFANFNQGNIGDADLTALAGIGTFDRCILEFDFKANGDSIFFKYVFGSEEYPNFNCTDYNDVFGFFISGPGYPSPLNIALVPGTTIPVAINSINNGVIYPGGTMSNCTSMGAGSPFTNLYIDNSAGTTVTYTGFTQLLTAKAVIQPCSTYHLKLAIADGFDHILDSGVFLKAGSLTSNTFKLKVTTDSLNGQIPYVYEGCDTAIIKIKRKLFQTNVNVDTVTLSISGTATSGVDYPALQTTHIFSASISDTEKILYLLPINDLITEGTESVKIKIFDKCNTAIDSIQIDIKDPPKFTLFNNDTTICLGQSVQIAGVKDNGLSFSWSPTTGVSNPSLFNPTLTPTTTTTYILTANYGSCAAIKDTITVNVQPLPTISLAPTNVLCNGSLTGSIIATGTAVSLPLSFTINPPGSSLSGSPAAFNNLGAGSYTVTATSGLGCTLTSSVTLTQPSAIVWNSVTGSNIACNGGNIGTISSNASGGNGTLSYTLMPNNITNSTGSFNALASGTYTVSAKDANNCSITSIIVISQTLGLTWNNVNVSPIQCNGQLNGAITVSVSGGSGTITYTKNPNTSTNTTGVFSNIGANTYTISAIDANGCTAQTIINLTQPNPIVFQPGANTNVLCFGESTGSISMPATGGSGALSYLLLPINLTNSTGLFTGLTSGVFTVSVTDANGCTNSTSISISQPTQLNITNVVTTIPTCIPGNNGAISFSGSGGAGPYTYKLNAGSFQAGNSFSTLSSSIYTITIKDANNCTKTSIVNLVSPNIPTITNNTLPPTCTSTTVNLSVLASNGIPPYVYTLMPNNLNNSTGLFPNMTIPATYTVTVTGQNGCSATIVIPLTIPPGLAWGAFSIAQIPCTGGNTGAITATVASGTNPLTFVLNPGIVTNSTGIFTNLAPNTYSITVIDANGCTTASNVNIGILPSVTFNSVNHTNISCNGQNNGAINVSATGFGPVNYTLQPGAITNNNGNFLNLTVGTYTINAADGGNCPASTVVTITQPNPLFIASVNSTIPTCVPGGDGSLTINNSGGTTPYLYSLNNGPNQANTVFLNLSIATYTVKVTDANGCTVTSVYNLQNPTAPSFSSLTSNQLACAGIASGTITALVNGGANPLNYTINPLGLSNTTGIFSNLPVNTYTVTVADANGCAITSTISINQPSQVAWTSIVPSNVTCMNNADGMANALASGGVGIFTYNVNPGNISNTNGQFTNLSPNNYTIVATDANGCSITSTFQITQPPILSWTNTIVTNACNNVLGSYSTTLNGGTPFYTYTLNPGSLNNSTGLFQSLAAGSYTIVGTDANNCTLSSVFSILTSPLITISTISNTVPSCNPGNNASITFTALGGASPLLYNLNGGSNQSTSIFNGLGVSIYTVNVIDAIGCSISTTVNISNPSSPSFSAVSSTPILCFAGTSSISSTASGGVGSLSYTMNPGAINSATGIFNSVSSNNYTITVTDANNCTATTNYILSQPTLMIWDSIDKRDVSCFGGTNGIVTSSASGGTGLITYTLTPPGISNISGSFFGLGIGAYTLIATDSNGCVLSSNFIINQAPPIVWATANSNSPLCFNGTNGSIQVLATGGNGGFEYTLMPGAVLNTTGSFTNLVAGTYTITAKDIKSCTLSTVLTVSPTPAVQLGNINTTFATCNPGCDGTALLSGVGGNSVYSYAVNGGAFQASPNYANLCAAVYTVVVQDGNNCTGSGTFSITTANGPSSLTASVTPVTCNGLIDGQISTTIVGGTGTITYTILPINISNTNGNFNGLGAGNYTISASDANGCTISTSPVMTQPFPLLLTGTNVTNVTCFNVTNGAVSTTAIGGNGSYVYSLTPSAQSNSTGIFNTLAANVYTINVVDANGCTNSASVNITSPTLLTPTIPVLTNVSCFGGANGTSSVTFSGGTGAINYTLMPGNFTNTTGSFSGLAFGSYTITATDVNLCTGTISFSITQPTQLAITAASPTVASCAPGGDATITIYSTGGTVPYTYAVNNSPFQSGNYFTNIGNAGNYTVTVLDGLGCSVTSLVVIANPPLPIISNIVTTQATCAPGCDGTLTIISTGGTGIYNYAINALPFQTQNLFSSLCTNPYTVTVQDALGCMVTSLTNITTVPSPVITNATVSNVLCNNVNNGTITLGWNGGTNPINFVLQPSNVTNTTGLFTGISAGSYTVTGTDANGCTLSTAVVISQPQSLQFNSATTTPPLCFGGTNGSIFVTTIGGAGANLYTIAPISGSFAPPSTFNNLSGNATYTISATDANGCTASTTVFVPQPTQVVFNSLTSTPVVCNGASNGSVQGLASGGVGTLTYSLQPGASSNATGLFAGLPGNTYTVSATDANGCSASSSIAVFEPTAVSIANATSTNIICFGQVNGTISITGAGGTNPLSYSIQPSNQTNSTGAFTSLAAAIYTVTIVDANNCSLTTTLTVLEPTQVAISNVSPTNISCFGLSNGSLVVSAIGGVSNFGYSLQPGNVNNSTGNFSGLSIGVYTMVATDANGCSVSTTATLIQPSELVASLDSIVDVSCFSGSNGSITGNAVGGTFPYQWTLMPNNTNSSAGFYNGLSAGTFTLIVSDIQGCSDSLVSLIINQPSAITIDTIYHKDIECYLDTSGNITVIASGGTGTLNYQLSPALGVQSTTGFFDSLPGGTYTVIITDANGCSLTTNVLIKQNLQIVASDIDLVQPKCHGEMNGSINIVAQGGVAPIQYSLDGGPYTLNGYFANQGAGVHTIIIMDAKGCSSDTTFTLTEPDLIGVDFTIDGIFCVDQSDAKLLATAKGGRGKYTYYLKPGLYINKSGKFVDLSPGTYTLSITDSMQCRFDTVININLPANPISTSFTKGDIGCYGFGNEGWAEAISTGGFPPYSYLWLTTPVQSEPKATGLRFGWHSIYVTDAKGCSKKDSIYIEPGPCCDEVFIPNAFTPNGDGKNDIWRIVTATGIELKQLVVYDRWGNKVWSASDITQGWDGTYGGKLQDLNTFYYLFSYRCVNDGQDYLKKGDVILMR